VRFARGAEWFGALCACFLCCQAKIATNLATRAFWGNDKGRESAASEGTAERRRLGSTQ